MFRSIFNGICLALFYIILLNLEYFVVCVILFLRYGQSNHLLSLMVIFLTGGFYLISFVLMYKVSGMFDYFWCAFKVSSELTFYHYFTYILTLILSTVPLIYTPILNSLSAIPLFLLMIYTLIKRPYFECQENYRSAYNLFVMSIGSGLKTWFEYSP